MFGPYTENDEDGRKARRGPVSHECLPPGLQIIDHSKDFSHSQKFV